MSALLYPQPRITRKSAIILSMLAILASAILAARLLQSTPLTTAPTTEKGSGSNALAKLPIAFEANVGQADPSVKYVAHNGTDSLLFEPSTVTLLIESREQTRNNNKTQTVDTAQVRMEFIDSAASVQIEGDSALAGKVSYLIGTDESKWHQGLPTYSEVIYRGLYPNIDLKYQGMAGHLKGTYVLAPGANPAAISWRYSSPAPPRLDSGNLVITLQPQSGSQARELTEYAPVAWQQIGDQRFSISTGYVIHDDGSVGFQVGDYDHNLPLIIDPTLAYSTYLGGSGSDDGIGIAVDSAGNTYVTGPTGSFNFPLRNALQPYYVGGGDLFVTKINAAGTAIVYSTYLGGASDEISWGMAVDSEGSAYLAGSTSSDDYPVVNAFQPTLAGGEDVIVSKINPAGTGLVYSTYLGGAGTDEGWNIAVSGTNAYVTGKTNSTDFPLSNAFQPTNGGGWDIYVTKLSASGLTLVYSTYLGGTADEESLGVDIDREGSAYVSGGSYSTNYPVLNAFQPTNHGQEDVVMTKLSPAGNTLVYSTYLGGSLIELPWGIGVTQDGDAFVTGVTQSEDFPVRRAFQSAKSVGLDGYVTRLSKTGSWIVYSTYLGGDGNFDAPYGIVVDESDNAYVTSLVDSTDFPVVNPIQATYGGNSDASVSMLGPLGTLLFSTYIGGSGEDFAWRTDLDPAGNLYTTGLTKSSDFPTSNATIQPANAGSPDAFVLKISGLPGPTPSPIACTIVFTDVLPGSTFYPYVHCLVCEGLASGYEDNTYRPNNPTSRGQLAKIVSNAAGFGELPTIQSFEDVPVGSNFYLYVERLTARGLVGGYACGGAGEPCIAPGNKPYFRPGSSVTRAQAAKIVAGTAAFPEAPPDEQRFQDIPPDHSFFRWVETMGWLHLISGYPCGGDGEPCVAPLNLPYFRPGNSITRGQTAKLVANTFLAECVATQLSTGKK